MSDRTENKLLVLTILTVIACTATLLTGRNRNLAERFPAHLEAAAPFRAVAVIHAGDCDSRLGFLRTFSRREFRDRIRVDLLVIGSVKDVEDARRRLRSRGIEMPITRRRADPGTAGLLGYDSTAYVVVFDQTGRMRTAEAVPATSEELVGFMERIRSLVGEHE